MPISAKEASGAAAFFRVAAIFITKAAASGKAAALFSIQQGQPRQVTLYPPRTSSLTVAAVGVRVRSGMVAI